MTTAERIQAAERRRSATAGAAPSTNALLYGLTAFDIEVLTLLVEGLYEEGIACRLQVTKDVAKEYVRAVVGKLGARSTTEAGVKAIREGLIRSWRDAVA